MQIRFLVSLAALSYAVLFFAACGDGPDDEPLPATVPATSTKSSASEAGKTATGTTTGVTPVANLGAKIGLKRGDLKNPQTTASGLKFVDTLVGSGATPGATQSVTIHYTGTNADTGEEFDSSRDGPQPVTFRMNGVIKGFSEGLSTMKVGGKRTILIPASLGYGAYRAGEAQTGDIIFEIELIAIK